VCYALFRSEGDPESAQGWIQIYLAFERKLQPNPWHWSRQQQAAPALLARVCIPPAAQGPYQQQPDNSVAFDCSYHILVTVQQRSIHVPTERSALHVSGSGHLADLKLYVPQHHIHMVVQAGFQFSFQSPK
jgi:hypothetical protein